MLALSSHSVTSVCQLSLAAAPVRLRQILKQFRFRLVPGTLRNQRPAGSCPINDTSQPQLHTGGLRHIPPRPCGSCHRHRRSPPPSAPGDRFCPIALFVLPTLTARATRRSTVLHVWDVPVVKSTDVTPVCETSARSLAKSAAEQPWSRDLSSLVVCCPLERQSE